MCDLLALATFGLGKLRNVKSRKIFMLRIKKKPKQSRVWDFLEQIGFVFRMCELFDRSKSSKSPSE